MPSILFVCTYNQFRSPLAEAIFIDQLARSGLRKNWKVDSAGTWVKRSFPPVDQAIVEAKKRGLSIENHRSFSIENLNLDDYDLILVMEAGQKEAILQEHPEISNRVYLLTEIGGGTAYSIPDPFLSGEAPEEVAKEIDYWISTKFQKIVTFTAH